MKKNNNNIKSQVWFEHVTGVGERGKGEGCRCAPGGRGGGVGGWGRGYVDRETIKYRQSKRACRHSMVVRNILTAKKQKTTKNKKTSSVSFSGH